MKIQLKLIFIFLVSFSIEKITIKRSINYGCNLQGINDLYIEAEADETFKNDKSFQLKLNGEYNYNIRCSLLANDNQDSNATETDDPFDPFDSYYEEEEDGIPNTDNRLLAEISKVIGSCQIEDVKKNFTFLKNNITQNNANEPIEFSNDFNISVIQCKKTEEKIESKLVVSFRQLKNFSKDERKILFMFYGMVSEDLPKGYIIKMNVNLIKDNIEEENKPKTAICLLTKGINVKKNEPVQGEFSCTIEDITNDEIKSINSFVLKNSDYIAGIPDNNVLLNPKLTEKYIGLGKLIDYSLDKNKEKAPSFNSTSIDSSNCDNNGTFIIKGVLTSNLDNDYQFELPLVNPENLTATCSIKKGKKEDKIQIECQTNGEFKNEKIMIAQNTILDNDKRELLIIGRIETENKLNCNNAKTQVIVKKLEKPNKISFRQVNNFYPMNKKTNFNFIGISDKSLSAGSPLKMLVFIIINGNKIQTEADCKLNSFIPLNSLNPNYGQVNYICEVNHNDIAEDLEIISSDEILGLNGDLEDYQKSPNKTDQKIEETKKEPTLGKVCNFSSTSDFYEIPPTFEISSMDFEKCNDKGKIKVSGKFNQKIEKKFDFTIPLSYPSSSIKCNAPNIDANREVDIDCKVQKDFYNVEQIIIEPRIIKKKNQEVIFIKNNYTYKEKKMTCSNYNTLQKKIEEEKKKKPYTFLQTNNFIPSPLGIFFRILIYFYEKDNFPKTIPVMVSTRKKLSTLRNLDDSQEEDEINCITGDNDKNSQIKGYNCTSEKIKASNAKDFEDFYLESDDVPGLYEYNSNPILTDSDIKKGVTPNLDKVTEIDDFKNPKIEEDNSSNCTNKGIFIIDGELSNKALASKLKEFEIHYSNPPDSYSLCNFNYKYYMECHNAEAFEEQYIDINKQTLGNGALYFHGTRSNETFTCIISSNSVNWEPTGNNTEFENSYFNKKSSSGGLGGGAIAAIVIISVAVLIGVGILIALIKNGVIFSSKPEEINSTIPPISNSSAQII